MGSIQTNKINNENIYQHIKQIIIILNSYVTGPEFHKQCMPFTNCLSRSCVFLPRIKPCIATEKICDGCHLVTQEALQFRK